MKPLALLITPSTIEHVPYPEDDRTAWLSGHVGGYLEAVCLGPDRVMWINEEGKATQMPNGLATLLAGRYGAIAADDWISGTAVITGAVGSDTRGLTLSEVIALWS